MNQSYRRLYAKDYFGHRPDVVSFDRQTVELVLELLDRHALKGCLDIGTGNGRLLVELRQHGTRAIGVDVTETKPGEVVQVDLSRAIQANVLADLKAMLPFDYLSTCLDVAEHIYPVDLVEFVTNLNQLSQTWLLMTISHRPSSQSNRYHPSVLPVSTWHALLQCAGFQVVETYDDKSGAEPDAAALDNTMRRFAALDPFKNGGRIRSSLLLLKKLEPRRRDDIDRRVEARFPGLRAALASSRADSLADIDLRFVCSWVQDIFNLKHVIVSCIEPDAPHHCVVLTADLPKHDPLETALFKAFCEVRGIRVVCDWERPEAWSRISATSATCAGSENSLVPRARSSSAVLALAQRYGWTAFQLQHGVLPPQNREFVYQADHYLAWGPASISHEMGSGLRSPPDIIVTGNPRFDLARRAAPLEFYFGSYVTRFKRVALVGTNMHWHNHAKAGPTIREGLERLATSEPGVLFIFKRHPAEPLESYDCVRGLPNCLLIDDALLLMLDLELTRIVGAADLVISSVSSLVLDSLVAATPVTVVDTQPAYCWPQLRLTALDALNTQPRYHAWQSDVLDAYYDRSTIGRSLQLFTAALRKPRPDRPRDATRDSILWQALKLTDG